MPAFALLIAAASLGSAWSYAPPFFLRKPESTIFTDRGSIAAHGISLGIGHTFECRLGLGSQRNRRRLDLRGAATLQIKANSGQIPLDQANQIISKSPHAVQPVIVCGPSGVGKVILARPFHPISVLNDHNQEDDIYLISFF
jgi:hypothetical protein